MTKENPGRDATGVRVNSPVVRIARDGALVRDLFAFLALNFHPPRRASKDTETGIAYR